MRNTLLTLILLLCVTSYAQEGFDKLMTRREPDCRDIAYNSRILFEKYYTTHELDSAKMLLKYWRKKCGSQEITERLELLLSLRQGTFNSSLLNAHTFDHMLKYNLYNPHYGLYHYRYSTKDVEFEEFTEKEFENLRSSYPADSPESLLCEYYSGNSGSVFLKLQTTSHSSVLSEAYRKEIKYHLNRLELHASFISGVWVPTGPLNTLGVQPEIGIQAGVKYKKMNYDFTLLFRPGKAANRYFARRTEEYDWELTNHFSGGYIGIDIGRDIFTYKRNEFQLTGGIAADVIEPFNEESKSDPKTGAAWSYNFNLGLGYRYYVRESWYLGLKAKYNLVNYKLSNTIGFTGNPVTIQLSVGLLFNPDKFYDLKQLKYKFRK